MLESIIFLIALVFVIYGIIEQKKLSKLKAEILEARIKSEMAKSIFNKTTSEKTIEIILETRVWKDQNVMETLHPHRIVADKAFKAYPGCQVYISNLWQGNDSKSLEIWMATQRDLFWLVPSYNVVTKVICLVPSTGQTNETSS